MVDVLIVGGGHAGAQCAIALRQNGFGGSIAIVGRENELPYERPPLSKEYFARKKSFERLHIRPAQFWQDKAIVMHLGREVVAVDPAAKTATLRDGQTMPYGTLVWATGGDPRGLSCPGGDLAGVHAVRSRADCDRLMGEIDGGARRIVVIGGGYIGLEAAAVLTEFGCHVTLLEAGPRVLARVAGPDLSTFYEGEHRAPGVDLRTGVTVTALEGEGRVTGVRLDDGTLVPADAVIVGIGIVVAVEPLIAAGARGEQGVDVDACCRTGLPDIYAIGDSARFACAFADGQVMRVESVQNANDQATCVARAICGDVRPYHAFPWFWSNQYDLKLQTAGIGLDHDATVLRGDMASRSFTVIYLRQGRVIALDCVNRVKDYVQGRKLVEAGAVVALERLADAQVPLKDLLAETAGPLSTPAE